MTKPRIIIPMAGAGKRFSDQGYTTPKPFIEVQGRPMIAHALSSFPADQVAGIILVMRDDHLEHHGDAIRELERQHPISIVTVPGLTKGQACTVLAARSLVRPDEPILIGNCDEVIKIPLSDFLGDAEKRRLDGLIGTFHSTESRWSFAKVDEASGLVTKTAEKQAISNHATIGWYYFRRFDAFLESTLDLIIRDDHFNNEYYVCPVYNYLIARGGRVGIHEVELNRKIGLGTPDELREFLKNGTHRA